MIRLRRLLPARREAFLVLSISVVVVHTWSIVNVLRETPALILRLSLWELLGVFAYTLAFALFESLLLPVALVILSMLLPASWFRTRFAAHGAAVVLVTAAWAVVAHYSPDASILSGHALGIVLCTLSVALPLAFIHLKPAVARVARSLAERATVLTWPYLLLDILGILIVLGRNLAGAG
ncbi:MAG: hypothetical protein GX620_06065 [Chloroflexi bacterium]|nr:hypothetical protein [Chloroflexota bacterium]